MQSRHRLVGVLLVLAGVPATALACLWDYDTLKQERARFPTTLELITGKFLRHSKEFYEWRIQDRLTKLKADPSNLGYRDDLAVAYEKTGRHAEAVETILAKEKTKPGEYETYSNLGTFHILAGDFEAGLPYIDKALAINPDAHFGRERYQKWLVEYALERKRQGKIEFPLQGRPAAPVPAVPPGAGAFHAFLEQRLGRGQLSVEEVQKAAKGVLGMMRFANHDNPLLLEALGDLLLHSEPHVDAKLLAARCYLKASYEVQDEAARQAYRALAERALHMQTVGPFGTSQLTLADLESEFKAELADADRWYAELKEREIGWIRDGKDADAEFDRLYAEEPVLGETGLIASVLGSKLAVGAAVALVILAGIMVFRRARRSVRAAH